MKPKSKLIALLTKHLPAALVLCSSSAMADTSNTGFTVAVIEDAVGSANLIAGNYDQGLTDLSMSKSSADNFDHKMGLCVAHIKTYKLDAAEQACSDAISALSAHATRGRQGKLLKAFAYSNRGIARFLNNENLSAYEDFSTAKSLSSNSIIVDNISYFKKAINSHLTPASDESSFAE